MKRVLDLSVIAVALTILVYFIAYPGPRIVDSSASPSTKTRCARIKVGSTGDDVVHQLDDTFPARDQVLRDDEIEFTQENDGACTVKLNQGKAMAVEFKPSKAPAIIFKEE